MRVFFHFDRIFVHLLSFHFLPFFRRTIEAWNIYLFTKVSISALVGSVIGVSLSLLDCNDAPLVKGLIFLWASAHAPTACALENFQDELQRASTFARAIANLDTDPMQR